MIKVELVRELSLLRFTVLDGVWYHEASDLIKDLVAKDYYVRKHEPWYDTRPDNCRFYITVDGNRRRDELFKIFGLALDTDSRDKQLVRIITDANVNFYRPQNIHSRLVSELY